MTVTSHGALAEAMRRAVLAQHFEATADRARGGAPLAHFPSLDVALAVFGPAPTGRALWANVLFSREHPQGLVAAIGANASAVRHLRFDRDPVDATGRSHAWAHEADWARIDFQPLHGSGPHRFVLPYPASLLKLMVAVGVGLAVDLGRCEWPAADVGPMITVSDNDATDRCVALLHRCGVVELLHERFAALDLPTLLLTRTTPAGGWRNADGAGVGHIHMGAWDTVRLLWLLDADAPPAPWLAPGIDTESSAAAAAAATTTHPARLLQPATRDKLRALLEAQQLHEILSSHTLREVPGFVEGLPPTLCFAHKTGTTENYAADAGIAVSREGAASPRLHFIVAAITNLGERYAPPDPPLQRCATTWKLPALGAALHRIAQEAS